MSYATATASPADRLKAASTVIGIHALLGAGLVAGLAVKTLVAPEPAGPIETDDVEVELPPIPEPEPVEEPVPQPNERIYVPPQPFPLPDNPRPTQDEERDPGPPLTNPGTDEGPRPTASPAPTFTPTPTPTPTIAPVPARPTNGPGGWITTNEYPDRDLRRGNEGTGTYRLGIGTNGRVQSCAMTRSTGHSSLDRQTCRVITRVARFNPATDNTGARVAGTYDGTVTWQIPD